MYTLQQISSMQQQAQRLGLKYPACFSGTHPEKLGKIINGYGSGALPKWVRKLLDRIFKHYLTAAAIHDVRYSLSDGCESARVGADAEFAANLKMIWLARFKGTHFCNPLGWFEWWLLKIAIHAVRYGGRKIWQRIYWQNKHKGSNL